MTIKDVNVKIFDFVNGDPWDIKSKVKKQAISAESKIVSLVNKVPNLSYIDQLYGGEPRQYYYTFLLTCAACEINQVEEVVNSQYGLQIKIGDALKPGDVIPVWNHQYVFCSECVAAIDTLLEEEKAIQEANPKPPKPYKAASKSSNTVYVYVKPDNETERRKWRSRNGTP